MMRVALGVLALAAITLTGLSAGLNTGQASSTLSLTVNSTGDAGDFAINQVCETATGNGVCTLRAAIQEANAHSNVGGPDTIDFAITGPGCTAGVCTIQPDSDYIVTEAVVIDGYSQTGATAATASAEADLRIEIDGTNAGIPSEEGLLLLDGGSAGSTIKGLVINNADDYAINAKSDDNVIIGNYLGTNVAGDTAAPNARGVYIDGFDSNRVGGSVPADRNIISGNGIGIVIADAATNSVVSGNYIGVAANGTSPLGNLTVQVYIYEAATGTRIGGTVGVSSDECAGECNVIDGGYWAVYNAGSFDMDVLGNYIGVMQDGTAGNGGTFAGVQMYYGSVGMLVEGNVIGQYPLGLKIADFGATPANDVTIRGNRIGIGPNGEDVGNGTGIRIASVGTDILIGGTGAGEGNIITNSTGRGVEIGGYMFLPGQGYCVFPAGVTLSRNLIYGNGELGIDLAESPCPTYGVTLNDAGDGDDGANSLQNFPELRATAHVPLPGGGLLVYATLDSTAGPFTIEIFANTSCDSSGNGEGAEFLGSKVRVDPNEMFSIMILGDYMGQFITATATDETLGNTSEFSKCREVKAYDHDADLDGCTDVQESGSDPALGGLRDSDNFWDFFDTETENGLDAGTAKEGEITSDDRDNVIAHLSQSGDPDVNGDTVVDAADALTDATGSGYHPRFDVGPKIPGGDHWDRLPADGVINIIDDYFAILNQVGHSCL